jgi:hypothetical protein
VSTTLSSKELDDLVMVDNYGNMPSRYIVSFVLYNCRACAQKYEQTACGPTVHRDSWANVYSAYTQSGIYYKWAYRQRVKYTTGVYTVRHIFQMGIYCAVCTQPGISTAEHSEKIFVFTTRHIIQSGVYTARQE